MSSHRKEKRTGVACEECRKKKKKCDGIRPVCTLCTASRKDCLYSGTIETRKRKEPDSEYVIVLEEQVATLRAQVAVLQRMQRASGSPGSTEDFGQKYPEILASTLSDSKLGINSDTIQESSTAAITQKLATELSLSSSAIDDLSALIWRMNVGEKGGPTFIGPAGNFCVPSSADGLAARSGARRVPPAELDHPIPDVCYDVGIKNNLLGLFFSHLNPIHQFLPRSVKLEPSLYPFDDLSRTILHSAVFAAGALFSTVEKEREAGIEFATCIDISCVQACREQPSLIMVQALSIVAWRELSLEHNSAAAIYLSMAGGLAVDLGLHVIGLHALSESEFSKMILAEDREQRLRTFWAFFLVDRIAATMLGRNCMIPWRRIDVPLLHSVIHLGLSVDEIAFSHQCRLWQLHDHFMDQIYSFEFKALQFEHRNQLLLSARAELLAFKQTIPQAVQIMSFNSATPPPRAVIFLQMSYQTSLLLIHRPYLREPADSSSFTLALATMSSAATRITQYTQLLNKHYLKQEASHKNSQVLPFILHHVLTASIMHLLLGTSQNASQISIVRRKLQICMKVLSTSERTWPIAYKAIAQIQELAVQWGIVGALPLKWCFIGGKEDGLTNFEVEISQTPSVRKIESLGDNGQLPGQQLPEGASNEVEEAMTTMFSNSQQDPTGATLDDFSDLFYSDFPPGGHESTSQIDSMMYDDGMPSWFDPQFLPDFSALQEVFDLPEYNIQS